MNESKKKKKILGQENIYCLNLLFKPTRLRNGEILGTDNLKIKGKKKRGYHHGCENTKICSRLDVNLWRHSKTRRRSSAHLIGFTRRVTYGNIPLIVYIRRTNHWIFLVFKI